MKFNLYDRVKFIGPESFCRGLEKGDIGYIVEDYNDGFYEVDFSTVYNKYGLYLAVPKEYLELNL